MDEASAETDKTPAECDGWDHAVELQALDEDGRGEFREDVEDVKDGDGCLKNLSVVST